MSSFAQNATIVLVHGAWADGSCWQNIILPLRKEGLQVTCAPIPLTSLTDDIAALERVIERTGGPALLAGRAYGGAVIAGPKDLRGRSLVYIAALAPAEGEWLAWFWKQHRRRSRSERERRTIRADALKASHCADRR